MNLYLKSFNPIVRFNECDVIKKNCLETKIPINRDLRALEKQQTPKIADITPLWFLRNRSKLSAMLDLESNGTEVTEIGIIIYNKYRIVWIYHQIFKTKSITLPGLERFVHEPAEEAISYFHEVRHEIVSVLKFCNSIVVKGVYLESKIFPELAYRMIDLNVIRLFPRIDDVSPAKILIAYSIIKPYLMLTQKQSENLVEVDELRHNPLIECYIFWFIMNNIDPSILYKL